MLLPLASCSEDDQFKGELYKKVIYLLSDDDFTFKTEHALGGESTGYVTVYCGGTEHIGKDVHVVLEQNDSMFREYNRLNYDLDTARFAHLLTPDHFSIDSYDVLLKASSSDNYSLMPIRVNPDGLSPDSTYMIGLRIKSVSDFETNPLKRDVLYTVVLKNDYATMASTTYYQMTGVESTALSSGEVSSGISVTRIMAPLAKNQVRFFAGTNSYNPTTVSKAEINRRAVVVTVNADNSLTISPYADIEVEQIDDPESNYLSVDNRGRYVFHMHYRYKDTVTVSGKTETCWITMTETCVQRAD